MLWWLWWIGSSRWLVARALVHKHHASTMHSGGVAVSMALGLGVVNRFLRVGGWVGACIHAHAGLTQHPNAHLISESE